MNWLLAIMLTLCQIISSSFVILVPIFNTSGGKIIKREENRNIYLKPLLIANIVNGYPADNPRKFFVRIISTDPNGITTTCGGASFHSMWVLTAASCVYYAKYISNRKRILSLQFYCSFYHLQEEGTDYAQGWLPFLIAIFLEILIHFYLFH